MDNKVVSTILGAAALTGSAFAGETPAEQAGATFKAKQKETVEVRFNGRLQLQYDAFSGEYNGDDLTSTNHFYFRRLRLGTKVKLQNGWYGESVFGFQGEEVEIDKAYIGYKVDDALKLKLGYVKVPFGFEETTSSAKIPTIERSVVNRFFADDIDFSGRHTGVHLSGDLGSGFGYAFSVANSAQGEGTQLGGNPEASNDMALFGRLQWESGDFLVGGDYGYQPNSIRTTSNAPTLVDEDIQAWTGYINWTPGDFNLLGEYFGGDLDEAGDSEGFAVRASYRMGKWEPVVRYAYLQNDEVEIDGDELVRRSSDAGFEVAGTDNEIQSVYFGVNYHHSKAVKFMAGYEIADAENDEGDELEIDGFRARVQLLW